MTNVTEAVDDGTADLTDREVAELPPETQVWYAIETGAESFADIDEVTELSSDWTRSILGTLVSDEKLEQNTSGGKVFYEKAEPDVMTRATGATEKKPATDERADDDTVGGIEASEEDVKAAARDHGGQIPVDRDYNWETEKLAPETVANYVDSNGEMADIRREIDARAEIEKLPRFRMTGPTGCGKTTCGEALAVEKDAPTFMIECHEGLRPNSLLGMPTYVEGETMWVDGPLTKALLASKAANRDETDFDEVFLIFDEVNRTTARTLGVVMSALDHRGEVTLNARGGETVKGDPMNLVVVSTMNEGSGYVTNQMDRAQKRRFGNTYPVDYIGVHDADKEVRLLSRETMVGNNTARDMVQAANEIRNLADDKSSNVDMGIPTGTMLDWAKTAWAHRDEDCAGGPLMKGARRAVLETFYDEGTEEYDTVHSTIESAVRATELRTEPEEDDEGDSDLDDFGFDESESDDDSGTDAIGDADRDDDAYDTEIDVSDDRFLVCDECGEWMPETEADEETLATMTCPSESCDSTLSTADAE